MAEYKDGFTKPDFDNQGVDPTQVWMNFNKVDYTNHLVDSSGKYIPTKPWMLVFLNSKDPFNSHQIVPLMQLARHYKGEIQIAVVN